MNFKYIIVLIALVFTFTNINAQISKVEILATGLTCSMCSNAINKQLKSLPEVDSVGVDLNTNTFTVHISENTAISPRKLKERVEKAGFFVGSMIVTMSFDNVAIPNDNKIEIDGFSLIVLESGSPLLNGNVPFRILDKGYVTQKEFKKLSKAHAKIPTFLGGGEDDYHIKIQSL
jgi:copper chaperone CopZ